MTIGKDLRIRLPESSRQAFTTAKAKAERELGYTLRDNEFATRVLVQAVREINEADQNVKSSSQR